MGNGDDNTSPDEGKNIVTSSFGPIWGHALSALQGYELDGLDYVYTGNFNGKPLGDLMAKGETPPPEILRIIGTMLDPPRGWRGLRFDIVRPRKRGQREQAKDFGLRRKVAQRFSELRAYYGEGCVEAAVTQVKKEFAVQRSFIFDALKLKDIDMVRALNDPRHFKQPQGHKPED